MTGSGLQDQAPLYIIKLWINNRKYNKTSNRIADGAAASSPTAVLRIPLPDPQARSSEVFFQPS